MNRSLILLTLSVLALMAIAAVVIVSGETEKIAESAQ